MRGFGGIGSRLRKIATRVGGFSLLPPPALDAINNQTLNLYTAPNITLNLDVTGGQGGLTFSGTSSNTSVLGNASITFDGNQATLTPSGTVDGNTTVTITVMDGLGRSDSSQFRLSTYPNIPTPTFAWHVNANGTASTAAGCITLTNVGSNTTAVVTGLRGNQWNFAGNQAKRLLGNGKVDPGNTSFGIGFFMRPLANGTQIVASEIAAGSGGPWTVEYGVVAGTIDLGVTLSNGTFRRTGAAKCELFADHWIYAEWDQSTGTATITVDDIYSGSNANCGGPLQAAPGNICFGDHINGAAPFNGYMSAPVIFLGNTGRPTSAQARRIWQYGRGRLFDGSLNVWSQSDSTLFPSGSFGSYNTPSGGNVIISTDIGDDIGDAKMLYLGMWAHKAGLLTLKAVICDSINERGPAAAEAFLTYAGMYGGACGTVPIGAYQGNVGFNDLANVTDRYADSVATQFGIANTSRTDYADSNTTLRTALAGCADGTVTICMGGFGTAIDALLRSPSDGIYAGNGIQLVAAKCRAVIWAAGAFPSTGAANPSVSNPPAGAEWDLFHAPGPAANITGNCPVPLLFSGFDNGVLTGAPSGTTIANLGNDNPLHYAQGVFFGNGTYNGTRPIWDELALWPVIYGFYDYLHLTAPSITSTISPSTGAITWSASAGNSTGVLPVRSGADYAAVLDVVNGTDVA